MAFVWQISYAFQQCKNLENRLRFDKVRDSLKVGRFFETQCIYMSADEFTRLSLNVGCSSVLNTGLLGQLEITGRVPT